MFPPALFQKSLVATTVFVLNPMVADGESAGFKLAMTPPVESAETLPKKILRLRKGAESTSGDDRKHAPPPEDSLLFL